MNKRRVSKKERTESMKSISEISLSSSGSFTKDGVRLPPQYRDIKLSEIMRYYTPKWMAVIGIFASIASAFQLPMFGYCLSQYVFVLAIDVNTDLANFES